MKRPVQYKAYFMIIYLRYKGWLKGSVYFDFKIILMNILGRNSIDISHTLFFPSILQLGSAQAHRIKSFYVQVYYCFRRAHASCTSMSLTF